MKTRISPCTTEIPLNCARPPCFFSVSQQTVYLWVEQKRSPHLRVMARNVRFLKSELEPFRTQFTQDVVNWQDQWSAMGTYTSARDRDLVDDTAISTMFTSENRPNQSLGQSAEASERTP